jgi:hypothetical protein
VSRGWVCTASWCGRSVKVNDAHIFDLRDGKVAQFWNASTDPYAHGELVG